MEKIKLRNGDIFEITHYEHRWEYRRNDPDRGRGYFFKCTPDGDLLPPENPHEAQTRVDFAAALAAGRLDDKGVMPCGYQYCPCGCGSGEPSEERFDGRGIYLGRCCPKCERQFLARFRPDIMRRYASEAI